MEIIWLFIVLGLVGGAIAAVIVRGWPRKRADEVAAAVSARQGIEPPTINYSSLKVSGVGGLGLVVVCLAISLAIPSIGLRMLAALGLGAVVAAVLVYRRRRAPLPSSGSRPGANTMLDLEGEATPKDLVSESRGPRGPKPTVLQALSHKL